MHQQTLKHVGEKYAFWTTLDRVVKEAPEHEQLFVFMDADVRVGRRGGGKLGSEECKVLGAYGRDILNDNGERLLSFSANHGLALLNTFSNTAKNAALRTFNGRGKNLLTTFSRGSETENSCGMLVRHSFLS